MKKLSLVYLLVGSLCLAANFDSSGRNPHPLKTILENAKAGTVVIIDLDDTIFSTANRNYFIFQEYLKRPAIQQNPKLKETADKIAARLGRKHIEYRPEHTLAALRISSDEAKAFLTDWVPFWSERFFSNEAVLHDQKANGATEYVNALVKKGAKVAYLTGRDEPRMGDGTRKAISLAGLPLGDAQGARLYLKPEPSKGEKDDLAFKEKMFSEIESELGEVIGLIDNADLNIVAVHQRWPDATAVWFETVYSGKKKDVTAHPGIYWATDFLLN